jgi:hypothetical protein
MHVVEAKLHLEYIPLILSHHEDMVSLQDILTPMSRPENLDKGTN